MAKSRLLIESKILLIVNPVNPNRSFPLRACVNAFDPICRPQATVPEEQRLLAQCVLPLDGRHETATGPCLVQRSIPRVVEKKCTLLGSPCRKCLANRGMNPFPIFDF